MGPTDKPEEPKETPSAPLDMIHTIRLLCNKNSMSIMYNKNKTHSNVK